MKILHVISSLEIGGAQRLLSDLIPLQKKQGIDVSLLVFEVVNNAFSVKIEKAGVEIISLNARIIRNPFLAFKVRNIIKKYDVVHAHLTHALYICSLAARGLKTHLIYTEHSTTNRRRSIHILRPLERYIYSRYEKLISISLQTQDALQQWLQDVGDKFVVIYNGVDISSFSSIKKEVIPKSLIMVSRFAHSKDQETVIRSIQKLDSEVVLRLVGDGENLDYCKQVVRDCHLENRVLFLGAREDVADLIAESYIGIQSSNWEGFGLTAVEIMACGKPIVASNVPGLRQVVEGAGFLFENKDVNNLAKIITRLIEDKQLYERMSQESLSRSKEYDINRMSDKYIELYNNL